MKSRKFAVIGVGRFGARLVQLLSEKGMEVMAIDSDASALDKVKNIATESLQLDSTDEEALEEAGIKEVDVVVVGMGENVETNILTTTILKDLGVGEIIARATSRLHARILHQVGASRVVFPEEDTAAKLAHSILVPGVKDYLEMRGPLDVAEIEVSPESKFRGRTIKEIRARSKYGVNIIMVQREVEKPVPGKDGEKETELVRVREFPREAYVIQESDILTILGEAKNLEAFEKACCE